MHDEFGNDAEGSGLGLFQDSIPKFVWREWGEPLNP
jgi:hypothetical protein